MASAASEAAVAERPRSGDSATAAASSWVDTAAWLCAIPCALVVLLAVLVLGPPLGDLLAADPDDFRYLPRYAPFVDPESTEKARFLLALAGPLLLSLATVWLVRRRPRPGHAALPALATGAQLATVALLIASLAGQYAVLYGPNVSRMEGVSVHWRFFTPATLAVAALLAAGAVAAIRHDATRARLAGWLADSRGRRIAGGAAAAVLTVVWLLHAVDSDSSIANAAWDVRFHVMFTSDEAFAVLNGLTPLVDFSAQYGSLWPFLAAVAMALLGKTLLVFTLAMCAVALVALLAVYDTLRRATGSALAALALYLPFLATGMFAVRGDAVHRETFGNYFGVLPLRYAGPYLLAWATARQIERDDGAGRAVPWLLFALAGLVAINNLDFGLAALGASVAALVWSTVRWRRDSLLRLAGGVAAGLLLALALVALLTLLRAGELPHAERMTDYVRAFALGGFGMGPIEHVLGLHLAIYLTHVGAIGTATVRALCGARNSVLTGMLAWAGVFGLGAGSYFVGRSNPEALIACFAAWALSLALLTAVVVARAAASPRRLPGPAALAVLFGFGLAVCSLAQTPLPWQQVERLGAPFSPTALSTVPEPQVPPADPALRALLGAGGTPVAILTTTGHRLAEAYGVRNVSPYTGTESLLTEERTEAVLDALARAGGATVVLPASADAGIFDVLGRRGYALVGEDGRAAPYDPERGLRGAAAVPLGDETLVTFVAAGAQP